MEVTPSAVVLYVPQMSLSNEGTAIRVPVSPVRKGSMLCSTTGRVRTRMNHVLLSSG